MKSNFTIGEAIGWGFQTFFDNIWLFLGILGIYILVLGVCISVSIFGGALFLILLGVSKVMTKIILKPFAWITISLVITVFNIGYTKLRFKLYENKKPSTKILFSYYRLLPKVIIASILYGLMVLGGLVLLVIPGIYLALRYGFFYYAIVEKNAGIIESFSQSSKLTDGIKFDLLGLSSGGKKLS